MCRLSAQTPTDQRRPAKTTADQAPSAVGKALEGPGRAQGGDGDVLRPNFAARGSTLLVERRFRRTGRRPQRRSVAWPAARPAPTTELGMLGDVAKALGYESITPPPRRQDVLQLTVAAGGGCVATALNAGGCTRPGVTQRTECPGTMRLGVGLRGMLRGCVSHSRFPHDIHR